MIVLLTILIQRRDVDIGTDVIPRVAKTLYLKKQFHHRCFLLWGENIAIMAVFFAQQHRLCNVFLVVMDNDFLIINRVIQ